MGSSTINTENGDTTSASTDNKIERLDARMSQFDVRCTEVEGTLQTLLSAAKDPATPLTPRALKRGSFSSSEEEGDLEGWDHKA